MPRLYKGMRLFDQEVMMFEPLMSGYLPKRIDVASRMLEWWESYKAILSHNTEYADIKDMNVEDSLTFMIPILIRKYPERCERKQITLDRLELALTYGVQKTTGSYGDLRDDLIERETPLILCVAISWSWLDMREEGLARQRAEELRIEEENRQIKKREMKQSLFTSNKEAMIRTNERITELQNDLARLIAHNDEIRMMFMQNSWELNETIESKPKPRFSMNTELKF